MLLYDALVNFISPADPVSGPVLLGAVFNALILWTAIWLLYVVSFHRWSWPKLLAVGVHMIALILILLVADSRQFESDLIVYTVAWYCLAMLGLCLVGGIVLLTWGFSQMSKLPKDERPVAWRMLIKSWSHVHWSAALLRGVALYVYVIIGMLVGSVSVYRLMLGFGSGLTLTVLLISTYLVFLGARYVLEPPAKHFVTWLRQRISTMRHASH